MIDNENTNTEFKILGMSIENLSIIYGILLICWGIIISFISGSDSLTSFIPSFLGFPIFIFSYLSVKFINKRKFFMHIVVLLGLMIFIGGLDFIRTIITGNVFANFWADISKLMMLVTGLFFTIQCIRSFIHARRVGKTDS